MNGYDDPETLASQLCRFGLIGADVEQALDFALDQIILSNFNLLGAVSSTYKRKIFPNTMPQTEK